MVIRRVPTQVNLRKNIPGKRPVKSVVRAPFSKKKVPAFLDERTKKINAEKRKQVLKSAGLVVRVLFLAAIVSGVIWGVYYIIQSGKGGQVLSQIGKVIEPLGKYLQREEKPPEIAEVIGVPHVPSYPNSEFVFENVVTRLEDGKFSIKSESYAQEELQGLYTFLASGQSVYRLPIKATWAQVQEYYKTELPKNGWTFVQSVSVAETEKLPGEYYIREEKGLHIYQIAYDIWYETVTKTQAEQGLRDKVVAYKAKQELVEAATGRDLPKETWWQLKYSKDWSLETANHPTYGEKNLFFQHDKTKERVSISIIKRFQKPFADVDYKYLEEVANEHVITWLSTQQISVTLAGFTKTQLMVGEEMKALELSDSKNNAYFLYLVNKYNSLTYVVQYVGKDKPEFYEYIKTNIKAEKK